MPSACRLADGEGMGRAEVDVKARKRKERAMHGWSDVIVIVLFSGLVNVLVLIYTK